MRYTTADNRNVMKDFPMTQTRTDLTLDGTDPALGEPLALLADRLTAALPGNVESITVVGSALTDDYRPDTSDINAVVVLNEHGTAALNAIGAMAKALRKKRVAPPLLMTAAYIERSRDVFGIEFLDFQLTHRTMLGDDPFADLTFAKTDVRLQCERELKATLIRLRQGYIAAAGHHKLVRDVLIAAAKGLAPIVRALLWLKDVERPVTMEATFRAGASHLSVDLTSAASAERWRYEKPRFSDSDIEQTFTALYAATDQLATLVDELEVA